MEKKKLLAIFVLALLVMGTLIYWGLKKTGALYFFYIPPSDFQAETLVERISVGNVCDSFVFTDNKESIVFSYFNTINRPRGATIKLNFETGTKEKVNYQDYVWSHWGPEAARLEKEASSDDGEYKFRTWDIYNWLNIDSGWGYQTIEIYTKDGELVGRYNSRELLRTIRWGKGNVLYFVEEDATGIEGTIKKILVQK